MKDFDAKRLRSHDYGYLDDVAVALDLASAEQTSTDSVPPFQPDPTSALFAADGGMLRSYYRALSTTSWQNNAGSYAAAHALLGVSDNFGSAADQSLFSEFANAAIADAKAGATAASHSPTSSDKGDSSAPTLSVDAANPANVMYSIAGLAKGYSGDLTFTDSAGAQDVIPVSSNGTFSTDISNLTTGSVTYLLTVSDKQGHVISIDPPLTLGDGSSGAPAVAPEYPSLLNSYSLRPSWHVAGVDYGVGVPTGATLQDPSTLSNIPGISLDTSAHQVFVDTNNPVTIDHINFAADGGWQLIIGASTPSNNVTVSNSYFAIGSNGNALVNQVSGSNATFVYDTFNGNSLADNLNGTILNLTGGMVLKYSLIENGFGDFIDYGSNNTVENNVFYNDGQGAGAHPDWLQLGGGTYTNQVFEFNTFIQTAATTGPGTMGIGLGGFGSWSLTNATVAYNTMIAEAGARVEDFVGVLNPSTNVTGLVSVHDNYIDPTGDTGSVWGANSMSSNSIFYDNSNMLTGAMFSQNVTSVTQVVATPSSGSLAVGNTVKLTLDMSGPTNVSGAPTLSLNDGGTATYVSGSGTSALTFSYTVGTGDSAVSALAIKSVNLPNGALITAASGGAAVLSDALVTLTGLGTVVAPTISGTAANQATTSEAPVHPFSHVTIGDANKGATDKLTITVGGTGGTLSGAGLSVVSSGVYSLSGTASAITSELQALTFKPKAGAPDTTSTSTFALRDLSSAFATATVNTTTSVIDTDPAVAPTISGTAANQATTSEAPVHPFSHVTIGDANKGATDKLTITVGGTGGTLSGAGLSVVSSGVYSLSGTASAITSELQALTFKPKAGAPDTTSTSTLALRDLSSAFATATVNTTTSVIDTDPPGAGGAAQAPMLLNGEAARPSWKVAGVNYAVGPHSGVALKDPSSISMAGVSVNATTKTVTISGNKIILDGYNFGSWNVVVTGANDGVKDSTFQVASGQTAVPIHGLSSASNLYVGYDTIDGGGASGAVSSDNTGLGSLVTMDGSGLTLYCNWLKNAGTDMVDVGGGGSIVYKFNLLENGGMATLHADYLQVGSGTYNIDAEFNTTYQGPTFAGSQGFMLEPYASGVIAGGEVANNTMIAAGGGHNINYFVGVANANLSGPVAVSNNYFDPTSAFGPWRPGESGPNVTYSGNVNMTTGQLFGGQMA
jgi:hypothetical protein